MNVPRKIKGLKGVAAASQGKMGSQAEHNALVANCKKILAASYGNRIFMREPFPFWKNEFHLDLHCIIDGQAFDLEMKTGKSRLKKNQRKEFASIRAVGGVVAEIRSIDDLLKVMEEKMPEPNVKVGV